LCKPRHRSTAGAFNVQSTERKAMKQTSEEEEIVLTGMDAFRKFLEEHPGTVITVTVDKMDEADKEVQHAG